MSNEQIKQNADAYADKLYEDGRCTESTAPTIQEIYIAGAHSRDEEIKRLYNSLEHFRSIINNLRNPWISVKDRLPKKTRELKLLEDEHDKVVIVCRRFREAVTAYLDAEEIWRLYPTGRPFYGDITHWMPMPGLPKGGKQ